MNGPPRLRELRETLAVLDRTGLFGRDPWRSVPRLGWCALRYGTSLYTVVAWNAWRWPERVALQENGCATSFLTLRRQADDLAARLQPLTTSKPGGEFRLALLCRNHGSFVGLLLACGRLGLDAVLLNTTFSAAQVHSVCQREHVDLLICDDEFGPDMASLERLTLTVSALRACRATVVRVPWRRQRGATFALLSSGTTGPPKTVRRTWNPWVLLRTATTLLEHLQPQVGAPTLSPLPLFHGHGLATLGMSLTLGAPLHLFARSRPDELWRCLKADRIEVMVLVPTVLYRLLHSPEAEPLLALRTIVCGSAPLGAALVAQARTLFGDALFNLYGTSEAGLISLATPDDLAASPGTVGRALPGVELTIQAETGQVTVRGAQTAGRSSFFETGDLGRLDLSGRLFLAGRQDDLMVIGGENVSPEMVEERILQVPYVLECAVSPLPSDEFGQTIHAHLVLKNTPEQPDLAAIGADLHPLLPRMLRPTKISVLDALPRTPTGKLLRRQLTAK